MEEEKLSNTKPIKTIDDNASNRASRYQEETNSHASREDLYKDALANNDLQEAQEASEEALAEKNIAQAEKYLQEEQQSKGTPPTHSSSEDLDQDNKDKKDNIFTKIKEKWSQLPKNKQIIYLVLLALIIVLIIALIIFLVIKKDENSVEANPPQEKKVEEIPVVTDNYYYQEGTLHFLDSNEKEIGTYKCENEDSKLCYVAYNNYRDGFDVPQLQSDKYEEKISRMSIYEDKYIFINDNKEEKDTTVKLYSLEDNNVINTYKTAKGYDDNYLIVSDVNNKYGLIQINNGVQEIIKPTYESLRMIDKEDNLIAKTKKGYQIIDKKNKALSSTFASEFEIRSYNNNFVVALIAGSYNLYNYDNELLASEYDYITTKDDYAILVKNNKLYIIDKDKAKYNEGNITLSNSNYIKTFIYDEAGDIKEIKRSFEVALKDNAIEIAVYKNNDDDPSYTTIDLVEGQANKRHKYVNYFDGKLYIYKDEDKQEILGNYTCNNKNYIGKAEDNFEYCFIAKDSIYEDNDMTDNKRNTLTPLINEQFVFIKDGSDTINLYDIIANKTIGSYTSINTNLPNNDDTFDKYSGNLNILALNKKGKYGILTIEGNMIKSAAVPDTNFDYKHLEKLGDYILAQTNDSKWKIIYDANRSSVAVSGKIRGYSNNLKYIKVKNNDTYSVYNEAGEAVSNETYQYVELYNEYYVGISKDNVINLYNYQGGKMTDASIKVTSTDFTNKQTPPFKVEKSGNGYNISLYEKDKYIVYYIPKIEEVIPGTPIPTPQEPSNNEE